jgi:hypothetical protein
METAYSEELKKYNSMTLEEFDKLPFILIRRMALSNTRIEYNREYGIVRQIKKKSESEFGGIAESFRYKGKWYSKERLVRDILKDIKPNNQLELFLGGK